MVEAADGMMGMVRWTGSRGYHCGNYLVQVACLEDICPYLIRPIPLPVTGVRRIHMSHSTRGPGASDAHTGCPSPEQPASASTPPSQDAVAALATMRT